MNMDKQGNFMREALSEFLGFLKYKVDNGVLTMQDVETMLSALELGLDIKGTTDDFANYFGKSKWAVVGIIKRKVFAKPQRNVVLHSFGAFLKHIPRSWLDRRHVPTAHDNI